MRLAILTLSAAVCVAPNDSRAAPTCDLAHISTAGELREALGQRAVDVMSRAGASGWATDQVLQSLVAPEATFSLGGGDVGRPLATGINGAHAMSRLIKADGYRFDGWNHMNRPADACARQTVDLEFDDRTSSLIARVTFTFVEGRVVDVRGWQAGYSSGEMALPSRD